MGKNILVIGSLNIDMVIQMNNMPKEGETVLGRTLQYIPGGKGANQACAAAKLLGNVTMLGCVGEDEFGRMQVRELKKSGVDISCLKVSKEAKTGTAIIYINAKGNNSIVVIQGANAECNEAYLKEQEHKIKECDYVLVQMEIPYNAIYHAVTTAKAYGKTVLLNPAPAPETIPGEILAKIDYLTPNETELMKLTNTKADSIEDIKKAAETLLGKGVKNIITTLGERGALIVNKEMCEQYETKKVAAVDTTAAGDCFNGALVVALAEGKTMKEAILFANAASAIAVTRPGAQTSIPTRSEVEEARK